MTDTRRALEAFVHWSRDASRGGFHREHPLIVLAEKAGVEIPECRPDLWIEWIERHGIDEDI